MAKEKALPTYHLDLMCVMHVLVCSLQIQFTQGVYRFIMYINISVYGWFQESFTGVEQDSNHLLEVGYQKGAQQARLDLLFLTTAQPILSGIHDHTIKSKASCIR